MSVVSTSARSSRFASRLPFLESKLIGVCSLLTSMRDLGLQPVRVDCSANRPKQNPPCRGAVHGLAEGYNNEGEVNEPSAIVGNVIEKCGQLWVKQSAVKRG